MIRLMFSFLQRMSLAQGMQFLKVFALTAALIAFSSSGFMFFELQDKPDLTWADAVWWSVVTMTTVGYGDLFPTTFGGRYLIGFPTMIVGISILGYLLSTVATFLIEARSKELRGMSDIRLQDHLLIVHYPSFDRVMAVVEELALDEKTRDRPIVIIDDDLEEIPEPLAAKGVRFVKGDASKESTLDQANFREASFAVILSQDPNDPSSDNDNLAAALTLEHLHPDIFTVAECIEAERTPLMYKAGCDAVVCLTALATNFVVHELLDPGVQKFIERGTNNRSGEQQFYMINVDSAGDGTFACARKNMEAKGCVVLGIEQGDNVVLNPTASHNIHAGDRMVCLASQRPAPLSLE
ncbi:MAG: potassium channel family protein [Deltaproteobacteria bacterium]|nr:potassium channel family protein [Deltaproteobacteria bacterium]